MLRLPFAIALGVLTIFIGLSLTLTVLDRNFWPVSSYNVFNFIPEPVSTDIEVRLTRADGSAIVVPPGRAIPIEFFSARSMLVEIYVRGDDPLRQIDLARIMLNRINTDPWRAFDETMAAPRRRGDPIFVRLSIDLVRRDYRTMGNAFGRELERNEIFEYRLG